MSNAEARKTLTIQGRVMHATRVDAMELHGDAVLVVDADGVIEALHAADAAGHRAALEQAAAMGTLLSLAPAQILLPGLVDLHVHAPQWPQAGRALHLPLAEWLLDCTFPLESRYSDLEYARPVYADLVATLLANGTTTAVYFATIHEKASLALAEICLERGQRAFVGRVAMDHPGQCPDYYRDLSAREGIEATRRFIGDVRALPGNGRSLVRPIVTPRFIPSCTDELLEGLGRLAAEYDCPVQTHCSESDWAHGFVLGRMGMSDTASLDRFGLLRRGSILAHGNFIGDDDIERIRDHGAAIAHCPISNAFFAGAIFPLRKLMDRGVHVGLGTDISGGYSPQLLDNARQAMIASRMLESGVDPARPLSERSLGMPAQIDFREAFWLATGGGGEALDLPVGQFRPGYRFDAILIDTSLPGSNIRLWPGDTSEDILQKLVCNATRADISKVWVEGRLVHEGYRRELLQERGILR